MGSRVGTAVGDPAGPAAGRPVQVVHLLDGDRALVNFTHARLGFRRDAPLNAGRGFAAELHKLCTAGRDVVAARKSPAGLDLPPEVTAPALHELKKLGRALRHQLNDGTLLGRLRLDADPALTFAQEDRVPVLWDMLYDADPGEPAGSVDWERFWGFRRPVSHWIACNRESGRIGLRGGLFTGVSDDLPEARREADWLREFVGARYRLRHRALGVSLWDRVRAAGGGGPAGGPLRDHLLRCRPHNPDGWASDVLAEILQGADDELQHFACHGEHCDLTQLRSRLVFRVDADTQVAVNVADFDTGRGEVAPDAPGRLVFLNACSSGKHGPGYDPPGMPEVWIAHRGALAMVVTLCPVPDDFAAAFARKFYELLLGGTPVVAEAFLAARRHFMERHNNPLGLAYVLYAFPGAHVAAGGGDA